MDIDKKKKLAYVVAIFLFVITGMIAVAVFWQMTNIKKHELLVGNSNKKSEKIHIFQKLPTMMLTDEVGNEVCLNKQMNGTTILLYWASWCPYCVDGMKELNEVVKQIEKEGSKVYLINKLDGEKENKEQAIRFLQEQGIKMETLFDVDSKVYEELGVNMIPTTIIVNEEGIITSLLEGSVPDIRNLQVLIEESKNGKATTMMENIQRTMIDHNGGWHTNYTSKESIVPSGNDILSESMGILLEYATSNRENDQFQETWNYINPLLFKEGIMPWVITEKEKVNVNALIDDFRIVHALKLAQEKFGGYDKEYQKYIKAIHEYNVEGEQLVDFYDTEFDQKASRFTLCYGDLLTIDEIRHEDKRFNKIYYNTLNTILDGQISELFPLYYSYYDYNEQRYVGTQLNMSEALTTLLHLAEVDELPTEALDWLEKQLQEGSLYAKYDISGKPATDGYYESTAVYALAVMIALEEGREDIAGRAITKMEQFRVMDAKNSVNGMFGNLDGTGIYSFDQGMVLLAYEKYERTIK